MRASVYWEKSICGLQFKRKARKISLSFEMFTGHINASGRPNRPADRLLETPALDLNYSSGIIGFVFAERRSKEQT